MSGNNNDLQPFTNAQEDPVWIRASLESDIAPLDSHNWFFDQNQIIDAKWLSRNASNCAYSFKTLIGKNTEIYKNQGVPSCARRLRRLLIYFMKILEDFLFVYFPR
jgi:hypothetical protein